LGKTTEELVIASINSGRRDGKPLVEDCLTLDLAWLMRLGPIGDGQAGTGEVRWSVDGVAVGTLHFRLDLRTTGSARLLLRYIIADRNGQPSLVRQVIALTSAPQHLGGRRWWLRCPVTGERARILYLPPGGDRFGSRKAWGLAYRMERLSHFDRPFEAFFRAQRRVGGSQGLAMGLVRPKGMWRRTYHRYLARFETLDLACAKKIAALVEPARRGPA
jgi:hypothetical protein